MIEQYKLISKIIIPILWIYTLFGFISDEIFSFLIAIKSPLFFVCDLILILIGGFLLRKNWDYILIFSFLVISYVSTLILNNLGIVTYLNGVRDFMPLVLFTPIFLYFQEDEERYEYFKEKMNRFILLFLIIQIPCSLYQFVLYGAGDLVGGSLGWYSSGILSTLVFLLTFYLLFDKKNTDHNLKLFLWNNKYYLILLLPAFLNETKVSFIYLLLFFSLFLRIDKYIFWRLLIALPFLIVALFLALNLYIVSTGTNENFMSLDYYTEMYLMNDDSVNYAMFLDDGSEDVPRFSKIIEGWDLLSMEGKSMFGFGLGHFKGGTTLQQTAFSEMYQWLLVGSVPYLFFVFMQLGICGLTWQVLLWIRLFQFNNAFDRYLNIRLFVFVVYMITLFYNDSFRNYLQVFLLLYTFFLYSGVNIKSINEEHDE